jgi:nucleoside phosphorylase
VTGVDVLVVTALKEEFEAARDAALTGHFGAATWVERDGGTSTPYLEGWLVRPDGARLSAALARPTRMGVTSTAPLAASLVERLGPRCVAMCGVCAGNPDTTARGDVVVAEMAYVYDEGRLTTGGFEGEHRQVPMADAWVRAAQELSPVGLPSHGPAAPADAALWLLDRLDAGVDPRDHPARRRYVPDDSWWERVEALRAAGWVDLSGGALKLTDAGHDHLRRVVYHDVQGPLRLPFDVLVGPMATGNALVEDGQVWRRLRRWGVRSALGLDMEAAAIAAAAHRLEVPGWMAVKGVMDHAEPSRDHRYRRFAARASAEVLWTLLTRLLATKPAAPSRVVSRAGAVPVAVDAAGGSMIVADPAGVTRRHLASGAVVWELPTRWRSVAAAGSRLLAAGVAQTLSLLDGVDPRRRLDIAISVSVSTVALSPDGQLVAVGATVPLGAGEADIELRRVSDGWLLHRLAGLTATVRSIAFSADGQLVAACAEDGSARVWDTATGRASDEVPRTLGTRALAISRRKTLLALGTAQGVQLWKRETAAVDRKLDGPAPTVFTAFLAGGALLVAGNAAGAVRAWSTTTWRYHDQLTRPEPATAASGFAVADDDLHLAVGGEDGTVRLWRPRPA